MTSACGPPPSRLLRSGPAPSENPQERNFPAFSLADLDTLIEDDNETLPTLDGREIFDLLALLACLSLALISVLKKSSLGYIGTLNAGALLSVVSYCENWTTLVFHAHPINSDRSRS